MDLFTLIARLTLDTSQYRRGINESRGLLSGLSNTVGAGAVALGNLAATGIQNAVGALVDFGKESIQTGINFEAAMDEVAAISGTTGSKFDDLVSKAMEMGDVTKFSATESAEAFKYMAMAGWDADQMMAGIAGTMNLAAASGESLGTVSDIVTDVLTAMGKSADEAGHFADVLAAASSSSNTNVAMMGETFKYAAPLAGTLGYEIEDLALATGLMANAGIKGSQAGTSLRSILTRMANPVKQSEMAMSRLGISIENSDGSMKSLREVMTDMREAFAGLTESEQAQYAAMLGGQEAMSGLLAIVNASDEEFEKLAKSIDESQGAAQTMADVMMDNLGGSLEKLGGALETLGLAIFDDFKEPLKDAIDYATGFISKIGAAWQTGGLSAAIQTVSDEVKPIFSDMFSAIETGAQNALDTGAGVIAGIYNGLTGGEATAEDVKGIFKGLFDDAQERAQNLVDSGSKILGNIATIITGDAESGEKIKEAFQQAFSDPIGLVDTIIDSAGSSLSVVAAAISGDEEAKASIQAGFESAFSGIGDLINGIKDAGSGILQGIATTLTGDEESGAMILEKISSVFSSPAEQIAMIEEMGGNLIFNIATLLGEDEESASIIAEKFLAAFSDPQATIAAVIAAGSDILVKITSAFQNEETRNKLTQAATGAFEKLVAYISELPQKAYEWGSSLIDKFVEGLIEKWEALKSKVSSLASTITGYFSGGSKKKKSSNVDGNHAVGLDYVPFDNYSANLHRGEAVLTRREAEDWRSGRTARNTPSIVVNQYISSEAQTAADLMREARWEQERGILRAYV